jgi:hypothetical protein
MSVKLLAMGKKDQKVEKALGKAADAILDILAEMPAEKARQARAEIKALALKSYRSANRGKVARPRQNVDARPSRRAASKSS